MKVMLGRLGFAVALGAAMVGFAAGSAAAEEVTVGDVTVTVPGLTINAGSIGNPVAIGDDDASDDNTASAGSTSVSVFP